MAPNCTRCDFAGKRGWVAEAFDEFYKKGCQEKSFLPRPDAEKIFVSRSSPLPVSMPLDSLERVRRGLFAIPWLSSSSDDDANRVLDLASGPGIWVSTMG